MTTEQLPDCNPPSLNRAAGSNLLSQAQLDVGGEVVNSSRTKRAAKFRPSYF